MIETTGPVASQLLSAFAALEQSAGVQPLVEAFFDGLAAGPGTLGLFTPTPDMTWESAAIAGERAGRDLLLRGEARVANPGAVGAIVLARLDGTAAEHFLVWTGPVPADGRLRFDGLPVGPSRVSRPVTLDPGSEFLRLLEAYAGAWAAAAADEALREVRRLRRAARTTRRAGKAFSGSQWVSLEITGVEIEAELTTLASRGGVGGFAAAAAAARTLHGVAAKAVELQDEAGLEIAGDPRETARALTAFLGGPLRIEHELARTLGIEVAA